jgi:hypothetical protein
MGANMLLDSLKQINNEVAQAIESVEAEAVDSTGAAPPPTNYSSSVTSCTVDPATGNISLSITLYPGETPINPVGMIPVGAEEPAQTLPEGLPPGQVPAAE